MIVYLELLQQLDASDDQMIRGDQVNQHLESNEVDGTDLFLSFVIHIPCGETPDIGVCVPASYLKPNSWLKSCFGLDGNRLMRLAVPEIVRMKT
jgi:hypothetical protein